MLYIGICCRSLAWQVLLKQSREVEVTGHDIGILGRVSITSQLWCCNQSKVQLTVG